MKGKAMLLSAGRAYGLMWGIRLLMTAAGAGVPHWLMITGRVLSALFLATAGVAVTWNIRALFDRAADALARSFRDADRGPEPHVHVSYSISHVFGTPVLTTFYAPCPDDGCPACCECGAR